MNELPPHAVATELQSRRLAELELGYGRGQHCDQCSADEFEVPVVTVDQGGVARCTYHTQELLDRARYDGELDRAAA